MMASFNYVPQAPLRIRCMKCDRPVDRIEQWRDDAAMCTRIKAFCHGATDEMALTPHFLAHLTPDERRQLAASEGLAFVSRPVGPATTALAPVRELPGKKPLGPILDLPAPLAGR